jgi:NAD(P)-dependent dehydrogenase (short-subunit alcohol dehydrogenase family)
MKCIDLRGKVSVVTGGAGQLGRKIVEGLAECGSDVAICYHSQTQIALQLKSEIESKYGVRVMAIQSDVTELIPVLAMKEKISQYLGTVDPMGNCAGPGCREL